MAAKIEVRPLQPFDPVTDPTSIGQHWKTWKRRFETYLVAVNVTNDKQKCALLLYRVGQETQEIFETFTDTGNDYKTAIENLDQYFMPKKNVGYEIFQFRQATQKPKETADQFVTRLRRLAIHCEFTDLDKELRSTVIQHCKSKHLRRFALREDEFTLDKLLSKARVLEASENQAEGMEQASTSVDTVQLLQKQQLKSKGQTGSSCFQQDSSVCHQCGFSWPHVSSTCPAIGKMCNNCGKPNHFAKMCLTKSHTSGLPQKRVTIRQKQKSQQSSVRHIQIESKELERQRLVLPKVPVMKRVFSQYKQAKGSNNKH